MADLVSRGLRTLCFAKSRRAAELIHRFTADRLGDDSRALALPRGLHAGAAARDRAAAARGRAARRLGDERARARDRRRPARLRDLGRLPRHGRVAAPAMGPRGPARTRARGARRERGRARPVLHARAARRCSAAGSRRRSSTTRTRACSTATCSPPPSRRRSTTPTATMLGDAALERAAALPGAASTRRRATSGPAATTRPRASRCARPAPTRSRSSTARAARVLGIVEHERAYSTMHEGAIYLHLGESYRVRTLDLAMRTAVVEPFTRRLLHAGEEGDDDRDRRAAARASCGSGCSSSSAAWSVTEQVVGYQRKSIQTQESIELVPLDLPQTDVRDRGGLVPARAAACSKASRRCRSCSARCTPPSTR